MDKNGNNNKNKKRLKNIVKILIALNLLFAPVLIYSNTHIDTEYIKHHYMIPVLNNVIVLINTVSR